MIPTLEYVHQKFQEYNLQMFDGKLPMLPIKLSRAKTFLGQCAYKRKRKLFRVEKFDFVLKISTYYDLPEQELEDTIIHEMIHYYIGYFNIKDTSSHGKVFRQMMNEINIRFSRNITISHRNAQPLSAVQQETKRTITPWHVLAIVTFMDGRTGIKVLPRIRERINYYHDNVLKNPEVKSVKLYLTNNPFFHKYPNSSALKVYFLNETTIRENLKGATEI